MGRFLAVTYGVGAYLFFLVTTLYAIGFIADVPGIKAIDGPARAEPWVAITIDLLLLGLFAVQHSVMARPGFKRRWTQLVPATIERSTFVVAATALLVLLFWQWQPISTLIWRVDAPAGRALLEGLYGIGWATVFLSTFLLGHLEFFGLQQVFDQAGNRSSTPARFRTPSLYKAVRHPLYLGFIVAFWSTPTMTAGHLLFAAASTAYIFVGMFFEERDLVTEFGTVYRQYQRRVPALFPFPRLRRRGD
jgi:protein-S-isoprenylcysteine O-methyltransferase Ste14